MSEADEPQFWFNLEPGVVRDLIAVLTQLRDAQVAAVLGDTAPPPTTTDEPEEPGLPDTPESVGPVPWWWRHKVASAFLAIIAVLFLIGLVAGGSSV